MGVWNDGVAPQLTWSELKAEDPATYGPGQLFYVSDVGVGGSYWYSNGVRWRPVNGACWLYSLPADVAHSGNVGWEILASTPIPAGLIQQGDQIEWHLYAVASILATTTDQWAVRLGPTGTNTDTTFSGNVSQLGLTQYQASQNKRVRRVSSTQLQITDIGGAGALGGTGTAVANAATTHSDMDTTDQILALDYRVQAVVASRVPIIRAFSVELIAGN